MFNQCLLTLFIIGSYNAIVGQAASTSATTAERKLTVEEYCEFDSEGFCVWTNEPGASKTWLLNPKYDYDQAKAGDVDAYPFMFFEKPASQDVVPVRLISHEYFTTDHEWSSCFTFSYKLNKNSKSSGLRVYQVPNSVALRDVLAYNDEAKKDYIIFEVLGDQGSDWQYQEAKLKHFGGDGIFLIVLEAVFDEGPLYVAVRDVDISICQRALLPFSNVPRGINDALSCEADSNEICGWNDEGSSGVWLEDDPTNRKITARPETAGKKVLKLRFPERLLQQNRTAHLMSPLYSRDLEKDGCFYFFYLLYSIQISEVSYVGLRVYQKPESIATIDLLTYSEDKKKDYILFETSRRDDQFISWHEAEPRLKQFNENFQIVIEGIFGSGPKQLKISEMAIRQGSQCTGVSS